MYGTDYFRVTHGEPVQIGELEPSAFTSPIEKGTMMDYASAECCIPGNGNAIGHLTKKVTDAGPSFEDMNFNIDLPAKTGQKVTLDSLPDGSLIEVEGEPSKAYNAVTPGLLVTSSTGAISTSTAKGTKLSCKNGRWYVAQTGDIPLGLLRDHIDPIADDANIRIVIEIRRGVAAL